MGFCVYIVFNGTIVCFSVIACIEFEFKKINAVNVN